VGSYALTNASSSDNVAVGYRALAGNAGGGTATAVGSRALQYGSGSTNNSAIGFRAMYLGATSNENTAVGAKAMENGTGFANTAVGANALSSLDDPSPMVFTQGNVAVGASALTSLVDGNNNIAIGVSAGGQLETGSNNLYLRSFGVQSESNTIRIGSGHTATYLAGVWNQTASGGTEVFVNSDGKLGTSTSSRRFKEDNRDVGEASRALYDLRPVSFRYRRELAGDAATRRDESPLEYGLVAEEVAEVMPELVVRDDQGRPSVVRYHLLVPLLLQELQRQEATLERQEREIRELRRAARHGQRP
jgi:hypothetical protein